MTLWAMKPGGGRNNLSAARFVAYTRKIDIKLANNERIWQRLSDFLQSLDSHMKYPL